MGSGDRNNFICYQGLESIGNMLWGPSEGVKNGDGQERPMEML